MMRRTLFTAVGVLALSLPAADCQHPSAGGGAAVKFGKLTAVAPAGWKPEKPANRLRSHQFRLPAGAADVADAEVYVMPDSSPKADDYFKRWKAQFTPPDGKAIEDVAKESAFEANGAAVRLLDVRGTWKYRERPFDPKSKEEVRPDYRAIWAVVVVGDDATHVRLSGSARVVEKYAAAFEHWLKSMK